MSALVEEAHRFAANAHASIGQLRKYSNEPYIAHPEAVAEIVRSAPHTEEMICAALLHDVVEDTPVRISEIFTRFGWEVGVLVEALTDVSKVEDGNRAARKALDRAHSAAAPAEAQTIKVADLIDNTRSIVAHDPDFAVVYMRERRLLLDLLTKADPTLREIAERQMFDYEAGDTPAINQTIRIAQQNNPP